MFLMCLSLSRWITNGVFADFFTVAVRTGEPGMRGISMMLLEKDMEGIECRQMQCMGVWSSGTTYITFDDVKVPASHIIGKENEGFKCIMVRHHPSPPNPNPRPPRLAR